MDIIKKIFTGNTLYYVVIPIVIATLGWLKSWYDAMWRNKKLGRWRIQYKKECPFFKIAIRTQVEFMGTYAPIIQIYLMKKEEVKANKFVYITICLILAITTITMLLKESEVRIELLKWKRLKIMVLLIFEVLFCMAFYIVDLKKTSIVIWWLSIVIWSSIIYFFSDKIITYDKTYANLYLNSGIVLEKIKIDTIRKKGDWISIKRNVNGNLEEVKVKESNLERVDYYGESLIVIKTILDSI